MPHDGRSGGTVTSCRHGRLPHLVMAARVAAIRAFGAVSKDVDGRDEPGHDVEMAGTSPAMTKCALYPLSNSASWKMA